MKKSLLVAACVTCGLIASAAQAQQSPRTDVVLVDLSYIFQKYAGFTEMKADLETAVGVAEAEIGKLLRVQDGRITDNWHLGDNLTFLRQVGLVPNP